MSIFDMHKMLIKAKEMQKNIIKKQEELKEKKIIFSNDSENVRVIFSGDIKLESIRINFKNINKEDTEVLEKNILYVINEGIKKAKEISNKEIGSITGGLNLPGF